MPAENDTNDLFQCLKDFMSDKLLFWIEAMNLINAKFECSPLLKDAQDWLRRVRNTLLIIKTELSQYLSRECNNQT